MPAYRIILLSTSAVLAIGMIRGESPLSNYFELRESQGVLADTVHGLHQEVSTLKEEISKIENSPNYAHRVLRDKYHVTEENESIVFFAD